MSKEKFEAILAKQVPDAEKRAKADVVFDTGMSLEETRAYVIAFIKNCGDQISSETRTKFMDWFLCCMQKDSSKAIIPCAS